VFAANALRVELNPVDLMLFMGNAHDRPIVSSRGDFEAIGQAFRLNRQRMIAGRVKTVGNALKNAFAGVRNAADLAMHDGVRAHNLAAKCLANGLVTEAHAENRDFRSGAANQFNANSGG